MLAINSRLGEMNAEGEVKKADVRRAENFTSLAIATLELDPTKAEVLINASTVGQLSLVLRSVTDFAENAPAENRGSNQAIRISSPFWTN
ncbi:hypothetical protein [Breoghania sp. L-A4]|uniref:hypothetical protein n=1 Tax=Breoghania sp. L-A4 TaxID=2304600 RepID=UPI00210F39C7|nr:hypothetical protein [Breoghania sp. L-A4]